MAKKLGYGMARSVEFPTRIHVYNLKLQFLISLIRVQYIVYVLSQADLRRIDLLVKI